MADNPFSTDPDRFMFQQYRPLLAENLQAIQNLRSAATMINLIFNCPVAIQKI
jgi:hypothetical protein